MDIIIFLLAFSSVALSLWFALTLYASGKADDADESNSMVDLSIPVLGVSRSGKTLLLATLGEQLSGYSSEELSARCFTKEEEQGLRGRRLEVFDRSTAADHPSPPPQSRTTEAMIFYERLAFSQGRNYHQTLESENAYFRLQFAGETRSNQSTCGTFIDIPGEHLSDERGHLGNIKPQLDRAAGLILVIDGVAALEAKRAESRLTVAIHYQQALEYFCSKEKVGPIWIVITKADLLPEEERDTERWHHYILEHVTPQLKLRDTGVDFNITLTSAEPSCEPAWGSIATQGETFLLKLRDVLAQRQVHRHDYTDHHQRIQKRFAVSFMGSLLMSWAAWGTFNVMRLPEVSGTIAWDWGSLHVASTPYLEARQQLEFSLSPLRLHTDRVEEGLRVLNKAHATLLHTKLVGWTKNLPKRVDLDVARQELKGDLTHYLTHQEQVTHWFKRRKSDIKLVNRIKELMRDVESWQALLKAPVSLKVAISDFAQSKRGSWGDICQRSKGEDVLACGVDHSYQAIYQRGLAHTLTLAIDRSKKAVAEQKSQVRERLSPLLRWKILARHLSKGEPMLIRYQQSLTESWRAAWQHLSSRLAKDWVGPKLGFERLSALQQFELDRRKLESLYSLPVPMPLPIVTPWKEQLNREVVINKRLAQAQPIITWAQDYLDHRRAARVQLSQKELLWRQRLTQSFAQKTKAKFTSAVQRWQQDLSELSSLSGASEIKDQVAEWTVRLKSVKTWGGEHSIKLNIESIECEDHRFKELGLKIDEGSWSWLTVYAPDRLAYYVRISPVTQPSDEVVTMIESGEEGLIAWSPWRALRLAVYDRDGDVDGRAAEESDDDLVGEGIEWIEQRDPPRGLIQIKPEGLCSFKMSANHPLPAWLYDLKWLDRESP